ncbi:hypothetical protein K435DRAFT_777897, partial [Dendrothele bispora CBS 962.96]
MIVLARLELGRPKLSQFVLEILLRLLPTVSAIALAMATLPTTTNPRTSDPEIRINRWKL